MSVQNTCMGKEKAAALLKESKRVALIGAGGVGMYSVARALLGMGKTVVGSDRQKNDLFSDLVRRGARLYVGECPPGLEDCDLLVYTSALSPDSPALAIARQAGIPLMSRGDALAGVTAGHSPGIAIAGMHGKSTVTAMIGHIFARADKCPAVACGALMVPEDSPFLEGGGPAVYEACEYMRSFLSFAPDLAVVLNIDHDHTDCYPKIEDAEAAFSVFLSQSRRAVIPLADERVKRAAAACPGSVVTFSAASQKADCSADNLRFLHGRYAFDLLWQREKVGEVNIRLPGRYNVENALAAAAAALSFDIPAETVCAALSDEKGVKRRMEYRGSYQKTAFYDDYAHHPAEIAASLGAARELSPGRLICVFQSHTYTRTAAHLQEIAEALDRADVVFVADIYPARETDTLGMSADLLCRQIGPKATAPGDIDAIRRALLAILTPGDTVVIMGAGDIDRIFDGLPLIAPVT